MLRHKDWNMETHRKYGVHNGSWSSQKRQCVWYDVLFGYPWLGSRSMQGTWISSIGNIRPPSIRFISWIFSLRRYTSSIPDATLFELYMVFQCFTLDGFQVALRLLAKQLIPLYTPFRLLFFGASCPGTWVYWTSNLGYSISRVYWLSMQSFWISEVFLLFPCSMKR